MTNPKGDDLLLGSNVNVTIYEGDKSPTNIRQTMTISTPITLKSHLLRIAFGSVFLPPFQNSLQGFLWTASSMCFSGTQQLTPTRGFQCQNVDKHCWRIFPR
jgi:hypothetical protein